MKLTAGRRAGQTLTERIQRASSRARAAYIARITTILRTLGTPVPPTINQLVAALDTRLVDCPPSEMWLALAVLQARLPETGAVIRTMRAAAFRGVTSALEDALLGDESAGIPPADWAEVEVVSQRVVVDIHQTLAATVPESSDLRLTREVITRWQRDHDPIFVTWSAHRPALTRVPPSSVKQSARPIDGIGPADHRHEVVLVPWRSTLVLPEPQLDRGRAEYLHGILRYSGNRSGAIGFDCTPLSGVENTTDELCSGFVSGLAALTHADHVATISASAAREYSGWKSMLAGTGLVGPTIETVPIPVDTTGDIGPADRASARRSIDVGGLPLVLITADLEPRMNHLAILHSAELLWREGLQFNLVFAGQNRPGSESLHARLRALQEGGRAVHWVDGLSEAQRWAAYELAHCTLAPARTDGAGLFVAESLAMKVPVITSDIASMREVAAGGGAIMIDPRDDRELTRALRILLSDPDTHAELVAAARRRPRRTWDDFAAEVWQALVKSPVA